MPRDEWAKANARAKYGPRVQQTGKAFKKINAFKRIKAFIVPAGVPCEIRASETFWRPYKTTKQSMFSMIAWGTKNCYVFRCGKWELKINRRFVTVKRT